MALKKHKISRVITRLNVGGPGKHVAWLSHELDKKGWDNELLFGPIEHNEDDMEYMCERYAVKRKLISNMLRDISLLDDFKSIINIYSAYRKFNPDIIHTHTAKGGMSGRVAAIFYKIIVNKKVKVVHTFHGHSFHGYFSKVKTKLFLIIERFLAKTITDAIITITKQQQNEILGKYKVGFKKQHHIIRLGIDLSFAQNLDNTSFRKDYNIPIEAKVFGIIGRIAPIKNHRLFIESIIHFNKNYNYQNIFFVIIGDGDKEDVEELKRFTLINNLNNLIFSGNQEVSEYFYGALDFLVLTSKNEGTPVSILESYACKIPVIATSVGGVPDLVGNNERGVLVSQNKRELAEKYNYILNKNMDKEKENAVTFVQKNYSVRSLALNVENLYLNLLGQTK